MDISDILFEQVPDLIGLVLVGYVFVTVMANRARFFKVVRSWAYALFVLSLAFLWTSEIIKDAGLAVGEDAHVAIDLTFVIAAMWLSVCMVSMASVYRHYDAVPYFSSWLRRRPVNAMTVSGISGIMLVLLVWFLEQRPGPLVDDHGWLVWTTSIYMASCAVYDLALPRTLHRRGRMQAMPEEAMSGLLLLSAAWIAIPMAEFLFDVVLESMYGLEQYNPYGWVMVILFALVVRSMMTPQFMAMVVSPEVESSRQEGFRSYDIPRGAYLIHDEKADSAFALFSELVSLPLRPDAEIPGAEESASATLEFLIPRGLVVTREYPERVRERHGLQVTPIIWLTESPGERRIAPTSLAVLTDTLVRFMENNPNSIVLFEGIEYVMTFNDFKKVLKALDSLNETAWVTKSRLLVAVHPNAFDGRDLALLERDRKVLKGKTDIDELKRESRV